MKKEVKITIQTPPFRISYPALLEPKEDDEGNVRYSCQALFDSKTDLKVIRDTIHQAKVKRWGPDEDAWPKFKHEPLKPMGKEDNKGRITFPSGHEEGGFTANFKSNEKFPPTVVRKFGPNKTDVRAITDSKEIYPGCWAVARIIVGTYETPKNTGVTFYLEQVCKFKEGEPLLTRAKAEDAFEAVVGEDAEF